MRWALGLEYDGTDYMGWQRLSHGPSVQAAVEHALARVADQRVDVVCAGRTDSGVDAHCQVVHFDTDAERPARAWTLGGCSHLPRDIAVLWAQPVAADFHARFDARTRHYRYTILNRPVRPAIGARHLTWERHALDADVMHSAAQALLGEHDFSAFRAASCQAPHAWRELQSIRVTRHAEQVVVDVRANAFLHHMVRNIVGSLLPVGRGERSEAWPGKLLAGQDRALAGPTAPAAGLALVAPLYPRACCLPDSVTL